MSTLSKIFVVLNLVLSIVFAVFVTQLYKQTQNWRQKHDDLEVKTSAEIKKRDASIQDMTLTVESLKGEVAHQRDLFFQLQAELARKDVEIQGLARDKLQEQDKNRSLTQDIARLTIDLSRSQDRARQLEDEREQSQRAKDDAIQEKERALDAAHEWELQLIEKGNMLLALRSRISDMSTELEQYKMILQEMAQQGIPVDRFVVGATPLIEGRVVGVLNGVVMISVGSDDGVREGYEFTVYRGDRYLCKIRIDKAFPDQAAGEILPDSLRPDAAAGDTVQANDHVSTRL
jgi:hypothetical protein